MERLDEVLRLERPLLGIDLETTTANPSNARIVEIGLEIMRPGQPVKEFRTLVNPGEPIPAEATAVHHITDAMVQGCRECGQPKDHLDHAGGLSENIIVVPKCEFKPWPRFEQIAGHYAEGMSNCDFAGYSLRFDLKVLYREFKLAQVTWDYETACVIDGLRIWQVTSPRTLKDAAKEEGIELLDAHSALADVKCSTRVIASRIRRFAHLPRTVPELHLLCSPDQFDAEGKLRWKNGELVFGFGEHKDTPFRRAPARYLNWIIRKDFSDKVKDACRNALKGIYPRARGGHP